jgi:multiple sugar transport system substrate-binding protein
MPVELVLSIMRHNEGTLGRLEAILEAPNRMGDLKVNYREISYETGWAEFVRRAIHGGNLDVSEMGTTWISDFAAMNALHAFSPAEIRALGGAEAFPPGLWRTGLGEKGTVWAIPWMTDLSLVYYRRDLLRKAGVDEARAFSTPEQFEETLAALSRAGVERPWVAPTKYSHITLHNLSMWLWAAGTDFVSESGKQVMLNQPDARKALLAYFGLHRHLGPQARPLAETESDGLFATGGAAVTISGPWLYPFCDQAFSKEVGLAIPLGQAHLGGSSLVIWESSRAGSAPTKLTSILSGRGIQDTFPATAGMLPARLEVLDRLPYVGSVALNNVVVEALKTGKTLPHIPLWGMIEDRLAKVFEVVWEKLLADPSVDIADMLDQQLTPDVNRLNVVLSN